MTGHTNLTWRRLAALREMASLGCGGVESARKIGMSPGSAGCLCSIHKISFRQNRRESPLRKAIRAGYEAGQSPAFIAERVGSKEATVKVVASQLGLTKGNGSDAARNRRGYKIPKDRMAEYKALRKLRMTFEECGYEMGLLKRPQRMRLSAVPSITMIAGA